MANERFTPGPWLLDKAHPLNIYSDDATGSILASCGPFNYAPRNTEEAQANAALIAAAPAMYEALKLAHMSLKELGGEAYLHTSVKTTIEAALAAANPETKSTQP